jgi:hypothetical protein
MSTIIKLDASQTPLACMVAGVAFQPAFGVVA